MVRPKRVGQMKVPKIHVYFLVHVQKLHETISVVPRNNSNLGKAEDDWTDQRKEPRQIWHPKPILLSCKCPKVH